MTTFDQQWPIDQARIDRNWRAVTIELDAPRPGRIERFLRAVGLPARITRLMVATPALRRSWYLATGFAVLIGLIGNDATRPRENLLALLIVAPLVPVLGVSMAYGVASDPAHEMAVATPMRGLRLILTRAAVVLGFSTFWLALAAVLSPGNQPMAFAWLLPAFGLTSATVAAMTFVRPRLAAATVGGVWLVGVLLVRAAADDPLAAFTAGGQLLFAVVAAAGLVVATLRRNSFELLELRG
jgi:hypothetical protein